jgi:hypothetical protein
LFGRTTGGVSQGPLQVVLNRQKITQQLYFFLLSLISIMSLQSFFGVVQVSIEAGVLVLPGCYLGLKLFNFRHRGRKPGFRSDLVRLDCVRGYVGSIGLIIRIIEGLHLILQFKVI